MIISIKPVPSYPSSGVYLEVFDGTVELGNTARFHYRLLGTGSGIVSQTWQNTLSTGQYAAWGESDEYVAFTVASNVSLSGITGG